jgi:hypothetical protein
VALGKNWPHPKKGEPGEVFEGWGISRVGPASFFNLLHGELKPCPSLEEAENESKYLKIPLAIEALKDRLVSGDFAASGLAKGGGPRVSIPAIEWNDLIFRSEGADIAGTNKEVRYEGVLLLRDDILEHWGKRTTLEIVLLEAANQSGGILSQTGAEEAAKTHGVFSSRNKVRDALKRLNIAGKQGRKAKTP